MGSSSDNPDNEIDQQADVNLGETQVMNKQQRNGSESETGSMTSQVDTNTGQWEAERETLETHHEHVFTREYQHKETNFEQTETLETNADEPIEVLSDDNSSSKSTSSETSCEEVSSIGTVKPPDTSHKPTAVLDSLNQPISQF